MEFRQIYIEHYPKILRFLGRLSGNHLEAEDLTQEVFIKVNEALDKFEGRSSLSTWIYTIATNTANDPFRRASFQKGSRMTLTGTYGQAKQNPNCVTCKSCTVSHFIRCHNAKTRQSKCERVLHKVKPSPTRELS
jgi:RNA polymerase sigma factor (sigma-70 family)